MKIRLDDVMQSLSYPFYAAYYYYIPLETVLMFSNGVIFGKAVHGISSEDDVRQHSKDFIRLPEIGEEGRKKVMAGFIESLPGDEIREVIRESLESGGAKSFESAVRNRKLIIEWYNYRDEVLMEFSRRWCEEHDLELIR